MNYEVANSCTSYSLAFTVKIDRISIDWQSQDDDASVTHVYEQMR